MIDKADTPASMTSLDGLRSYLIALGRFLIDAGNRLIDWADQLRELTDNLDVHHPAWRSIDPGCPPA